MNELPVHEEEQHEHLLKNKRKQTGENFLKRDDTLFSPLSPVFCQATKKWMVFKAYIFVVVLPFQRDRNKRNINLSGSYVLFPPQIMKKNKTKKLE